MHKKFEVNRTKIKGGCQSYTKSAPRESWRDFTLKTMKKLTYLRDILWLSVWWGWFWHRRRTTVSFDRIVQIRNVLWVETLVKSRGRVDATWGNTMAWTSAASRGRAYIVVIPYDMVIGRGRGRGCIIHPNTIHHGHRPVIKTSQNIFY